MVKAEVDAVAFVVDAEGYLVSTSSGSVTSSRIDTCNEFDRLLAMDSDDALIRRSMQELGKRFDALVNMTSFNEVVGQGNPDGTIRLILEPFFADSSYDWFIVVAYHEHAFVRYVHFIRVL